MATKKGPNLVCSPNARSVSFACLVMCLLVSMPGITSKSNTQRVNFEGSARNNLQEQVLGSENVQRECSFTLYPELCIRTLSSKQGLKGKHVDFVAILVEKTKNDTKMPTTTLRPNQLESLENQNSQVTAAYCHELMDQSLKRLDQSLAVLKKSPERNKQDIQTWLSAVQTFQEACKDSLNGLTGNLISQISSKMDYLSQLTSNSLALANRISGKDLPENITGNSFPSWVSRNNRRLLQSTTIKPNAVVAKDGTGNYMTISDALKSASGSGRYVIYVKSGTYKEKIATNKDGITLIGDGKYSTIITGDDSVAGGSSLAGTSTFAISGDGFIARDIGFQNTAGPRASQAVAVRTTSDRSVFYRCSIVGYQDTLYALANRQFYRDCDIAGTVDFIFGNAAAVFQNCNLLLRRYPHSYGVILANGRNDPGQNTGFSVHNCRITGASDLAPVKNSVEAYLGRPWKDYSRSVIMLSNIDSFISPRGWIQWEGNFALKTCYFAEYLNAGSGAGTAGRVKWPGFHVIGSEVAVKFTVGSFISGSSWLPSTGVEFKLGLG